MKVYLDYAATAPLLPEAKKAMLEAMDRISERELGNASALHSAGRASLEILEQARADVARLINAEPEEIIFTSGGSEANNTVAETFRDQAVAYSAIEHPSVRESLQARASRATELPVDRYGRISPDVKIPQDTRLVSVMLANNELGTLEPVAELVKRCKNDNNLERSTSLKCCKNYNNSQPEAIPDAKRCKKYNDTEHNTIYFHSDATQALGKVKIDVKALGVDYLTMSAHKIGGPIGVGALYVRKGAPFRPLILGGHQENRRRAGTSNVVAAAGFGAAAAWCWDHWSCRQWAKIRELRNYLAERILAEVPHSSLNSPLEGSLPNILNVSFAAAEGESIQLYLDLEGISVSTGSACAAGDLQPSPVLMATRGDAEVAHSSVRFSLGLDTTKSDLDYVMTVLPGIIRRLQGISTIKIQEQHER